MRYLVAESPFELPVAIFRLAGSAERPPAFGPGAPAATAFRGAFDTMLRRFGCLGSSPPCEERTEPGPLEERVACEAPERCPVAVLYKPRSVAQRRDHPAPVILRPRFSGCDVEIDLVVWGRRATLHEDAVFATLGRVAGGGLIDSGGPLRLELSTEKEFSGTLAQYVERVAPAERRASLREALLELATPCDTRDVRSLLGALAHDLVQWDLEDRGLARVLGKRGCDELAEAVRAEALGALEGVGLEAPVLERQDLGPRRSRTNDQTFHLRGLQGHFTLRGDLARAWPWLVTLSLRGAGRKKAFGLGEVRLWLPPERVKAQGAAPASLSARAEPGPPARSRAPSSS